MKKLIIFSLLLLSTFSHGAGSSAESKKFSCAQFVGEWRGSHTYDDGHQSDYVAIHHSNGLFEIHFASTDVNGQINKSFTEGTWECRGEEFLTTTKEDSGSTITFKYRVLYFDGIKMRYQNFSNQEGSGPTFEANKINL